MSRLQLLAEPTSVGVKPEQNVDFLSKTLKELDGCQSDLDIQQISSKIGLAFANSEGFTQDKILVSIQKAESVLRQDGQLVKAGRMAKIGKLVKKLPTQNPKKQRKMLREILKLCAKNVGVSIGKRSLCCGSNSLLCNAAILTGSILVLAGATTVIAMAAAGEFADPEDTIGASGNDGDNAEELEEPAHEENEDSEARKGRKHENEDSEARKGRRRKLVKAHGRKGKPTKIPNDDSGEGGLENTVRTTLEDPGKKRSKNVRFLEDVLPQWEEIRTKYLGRGNKQSWVSNGWMSSVQEEYGYSDRVMDNLRVFVYSELAYNRVTEQAATIGKKML